MAHSSCAPGNLPHQGIGFRQDLFKRFALVVAFFEFGRFVFQGFIGERLQFLL
jgi:hypothetical protein